MHAIGGSAAVSQSNASRPTVRLFSRIFDTNRCMLSAFGQKASRNSPSNAKFIFGPSCWMRGLIKPPEGCAVAYLDWEQQEFGIASALSNDRNMIDDYNSGDAYLGFAKRAKPFRMTAPKRRTAKYVICSHLRRLRDRLLAGPASHVFELAG